MRNLHCGGHFLRLLRSICAKAACARRAIVALFVVVATILATFMIMPSASMGASQQGEPSKVQTQAEKTENRTAADVNTAENKADAKGGASASGENGESKSADLRAVESVNPQPSTNPDASNADHAQNVDSEKKQNPAVGDKKDAAKDTKIEEFAKKLRRQRRELGNTRAATGKVELPAECIDKGKNTLSSCYKIDYYNSRSIVKSNNPIEVKRGSDITITPEFKFRFGKKQKTTVPEGVWFTLEKDGENPLPSWVNFEKDSGATKVHDTTNGQTGFDGSVTLRPGKWDRGSHKFKIGIYHPADIKGKKIYVNVKIARSVSGDLTLNVYNHEDSDSTRSEINDKTGITFESGEDGKYSEITPIFIDSQSKKEPGFIYHHIICHKDGSDGSGDSNENYTVDKVNGLSLSAKNSNSGIQTQFKHVENNKPSTGADAYAVYEKGDDSITERSQSWITGKPQAQSDGTFECKVFAVKDTKLIHIRNQYVPKEVKDSSVSDEFSSKIKDKKSIAQLFANPESNMVDSSLWTNSNDITKTIDWDYKTIKIVFKSKKKKQLEVKDGDLKLNVYPFKSNYSGSGGASSALADGDTVSVMKGIELKPFIEATSKADSTKQITLKMLCSKGEKPQKTNAGAAGGASNASKTGAADFEYTKWVDPSNLGFSFPDDKAQKPCTSNEGEQSCTPDGSTTKFAARTNASATFMSTEDGYYKCVVYALKPDALTKFNAVTTATPDTLSTAFAGLKADKDYAQSAVYIHVTKDFTLPHTGGQSWNLQLGAVAAVMVSVLAAGFVISQSEACRKLLYERRRC
ncbi:LPXTG-motif protein cell wall anchor domain protein [Gardnerella pickettii JCP7659]|uniref:hypothetical protein n=1 Tax=Gardnerella pickettii TaxID=2914924 RepID=UPI000353EC87|nr:hypothetical protein [Gardnerella pickettii]EPI53084.1 LPXTG-motif protein cell wall anchor domain protein [Gardnerella pickettii JCP7659]